MQTMMIGQQGFTGKEQMPSWVKARYMNILFILDSPIERFFARQKNGSRIYFTLWPKSDGIWFSYLFVQ